MKKLFLSIAFACSIVAGFAQNTAESLSGWKLGSQAYTFRLFSFEEALIKLNSIGIKYVELYPGQKITANSKSTTSYTATPAEISQIKALLDKYQVKPTCYGVVNGKNGTEWKQIFEFAKALGIGTIHSEPTLNLIDTIEKLCISYQIKVAFHNHPVPSPYWHPRVIMEVLKNRSPLMGACADIGHWVRSGLNPVECLKELEGRVISFHMKDLNEFGNKKAHDVPWGTGNTNMAGVLNEIKRQGIKPNFSIEYEYKWENNIPEIKESIEYFNRVVTSIFSN